MRLLINFRFFKSNYLLSINIDHKAVLSYYAGLLTFLKKYLKKTVMILTPRYGFCVQKKQIVAVARNFKKVRLVKALEIEISQQ